MFEIESLNLSVKGLVSYPLVQDLSFKIAAGEAMALVGESGCGKSLTCWSALGLPPRGVSMSAAKIRFSGLNLAGVDGINHDAYRGLRGSRISMIFQDPVAALNPIRKVGTFLVDLLKRQRSMDDRSAKAEALRLLDAVGIPKPAQRMSSYPHELSGGQSQRVMIAGALTGNPELIIADEPTTALDVTTQAQIMSLLEELRKDRGMGLLIVSHDLGVIAESADTVAVMYAGRIVESGPVEQVFSSPAHPYTQGLLHSVPPEHGRAPLTPIPGSVPTLDQLPQGCAFAERCSRSSADPCELTVPKLLKHQDREFACWNPTMDIRN